MTFDQIKKRVGKNLKYYDDSAGWTTGADVTETDVGDYVNEVYTEEMFPIFAQQWPHLFRQTGLLNSWLMTTTVDTSSTGTTLVITASDSASFSNLMVGLTVYNSTDDESAVIESYTSTSQVTLDTTIGDTWDGDTIYVLGQEFAFGGNATDIFKIERVRVKYGSTDDNYAIAELRDKQDIFVSGNEVGSKSVPYAYLTSILDGSNMYNAIGLWPAFDERVTNGIEVEYIAKPGAITGSSVTPIIPIQESLITGGTMKAFEKRQDFDAAQYWAIKYQAAQRRDISRYSPDTSNVPTRIKANRNAYYIQRRII